MPTAPPPPSQPEPGRPLSGHERRMLAELGEQLEASDPALAELSRSLPTRPPRRARLTPDRVLQVAALVAIAVVVLPANWTAMFLALTVTVAFPLLLVLLVGLGAPEDRPPRPPEV